MKLKNKKTGEIVDLSEGVITDTYGGEKIQIKPVAIINNEGYVYSSLAELNEEWEDYKEPKWYWHIGYDGKVFPIGDHSGVEDMKQIGNYFSSREEAELAVRKLKAWKRLKDKGFRFTGFNACSVDYDIGEQYRKYISQDLDLLFGGEDEQRN